MFMQGGIPFYVAKNFNCFLLPTMNKMREYDDVPDTQQILFITL